MRNEMAYTTVHGFRLQSEISINSNGTEIARFRKLYNTVRRFGDVFGEL